MSDWSGPPSPDAARERRRETALREFNANRAGRHLRALTQAEYDERCDLTARYAAMAPGPEREALCVQIAKLDGKVERRYVPAAMPDDLRTFVAGLGTPRGLVERRSGLRLDRRDW